VRFAALLAVALWALAAAAQDAKPPAEPPAAPPPAEIIAIGSVASRSSAVEGRIKKLEADLAKATLENRAQADLDEVAASVEEARAGLDAAFERASLASELRGLSTRWDGYAERVTDIEEALGERVGKLAEELTAIRDTGELWKRTEANARDAKAPQAVRSRISETRELLRSAEASITKQRNAALELQSRAAKLMESIAPVKERIGKTSEAMAAGLLVRQDEPLWRAWPGWDQFAEDNRAVVDGIAHLIQEFESYTQRKSGALVAHALAILGLAWLFLRTRRFVNAQYAATGVDPGGALQHPSSAAILAGFLLTPALQPEIVRSLLLLGAAATLPFWYRVLSGMLPVTLQGTLRGAALLTLVEVIRLGLFAEDFVGRLVLLAELLAGAAGVLWLRRPARLAVIPARLRDSGWMRLLDGWLRLVLVLFSVGVVSAVVGYTSLAGRLCMLAISGSFYGAGLMAMVRILELVSEHFLSASFFDGIHMIRDRRGAVVSRLSTVFRVGGFGVWAYRELGRAQLWEPLSGAVGAALAQPLGFGTAHFTLGSILAFALTLWLSWLVARFVGSLLNDEVFPRLRMPQGVPFALSRFAHYGVLVIGFMIAMGTLGFSLDRVTLLLSALGVGIGFGLQTVVNNFVSGVILLFERPVRVGDRVQIADLLGVVTHIGIRASRIRTFDGSDVIVPNGDLIASQLINWTLSDAKRRIILPVGVAYGTDPEKVLAILERIAKENSEVLADPPPETLFRNFGDSSLDFELRAWTESVRGWNPVRSDLAVAITRAFAEAGIQIPFPQRDLHLRNLDDVREALDRK
jgi:small-conductance mechanosensitive channel/predicted  nucleic acid-binding Zn-ribbon protein